MTDGDTHAYQQLSQQRQTPMLLRHNDAQQPRVGVATRKRKSVASALRRNLPLLTTIVVRFWPILPTVVGPQRISLPPTPRNLLKRSIFGGKTPEMYTKPGRKHPKVGS